MTPEPKDSFATSKPNQSVGKTYQIVCYQCKAPNHKRAQCPMNVKNSGQGGKQPTAAFLTEIADLGKCKYLIPLFVGTNPQPLISYRDTGAGLTVIKRECIDDSWLTGETRTIAVVGGQTLQVEMATVKLWSPHFNYASPITVNVALMDETPYNVAVLLGNYVFDKFPAISDIISVKIANHEWAGRPSVVPCYLDAGKGAKDRDATARESFSETEGQFALDVDPLNSKAVRTESSKDGADSAGERVNSQQQADLIQQSSEVSNVNIVQTRSSDKARRQFDNARATRTADRCTEMRPKGAGFNKYRQRSGSAPTRTETETLISATAIPQDRGGKSSTDDNRINTRIADGGGGRRTEQRQINRQTQ